MTPGEIVRIAFLKDRESAVLTFADGATEIRKCSLWEASEWASAAGLIITFAAGQFLRWELPPKSVTDPQG